MKAILDHVGIAVRSLEERRDPVSFRDAEACERVGEPVALGVHPPGAVLGALEVEVRAVGVDIQPPSKGVQHGRLWARRHGN